jgi:hypothetical protein
MDCIRTQNWKGYTLHTMRGVNEAGEEIRRVDVYIYRYERVGTFPIYHYETAIEVAEANADAIAEGARLLRLGAR